MVDYSYLRPKKAVALQRWHESRFEERNNDLKCDSYENAVILPIKRIENETLQFGHGGVIVNGEYVDSSGIEGRVGGYYSFSEVEQSKLTVVYCGYLVNQWGHFLTESVSRLWYCLDNPSDVDKYVFITKIGGSTKLTGNYSEFLRLLGILDKVEVINQPKEYKKVYVPELSYSRKHYYSDGYQRVFDRVIEQAMKSCTLTERVKNVFLSRGRFEKAKQAEAGLKMLDNYFSENGYRIEYPELISLTDMIYYLQKSDVCAAESGTLPHNFLFAQQGKKCIIIERQATINEIQANIDIIKKLNVIYIDAHFTIYPVSAGYGPYFLAYNNLFRRFTSDMKYREPEKYYLGNHYIEQCIKNYMRAYKEEYGYKWGLEPWMLMYADIIYEAYDDSLTVLDDYLSERKPFMLKQYFRPKYWKQFLRRIIR